MNEVVRGTVVNIRYLADVKLINANQSLKNRVQSFETSCETVNSPILERLGSWTQILFCFVLFGLTVAHRIFGFVVKCAIELVPTSIHKSEVL
jgi:hypothetical protein